jgi:hypothetical protein
MGRRLYIAFRLDNVLYASLFLDEMAFSSPLFLVQSMLFLDQYQERQGLFLVRVLSLYIHDLI